MGRIKAYTWHDAIEYIKNNLFHNRSNNLNINCEKDFAYLKEKTEPYIIDNDTKEESLGYKIHLNKKGSESESFSLRDENFWDLTIALITNSNNSSDVVIPQDNLESPSIYGEKLTGNIEGKLKAAKNTIKTKNCGRFIALFSYSIDR